MNISSAISFLKNVLSTLIALTTVLIATSTYIAGIWDGKIVEVANITAQRTVVLLHVEDAARELDVEHDKYVNGQEADIRKRKLEFILKYQADILKQYPVERNKLIWADKFYNEVFIDRVNN